MDWIVAALLAGAAWWWLRPKPAGGAGEAEARRLLGVGADAGADEVRAAHQRLIARVHPDAGGTAALAARVNAARDLLVRKLDRAGRRPG